MVENKMICPKNMTTAYQIKDKDHGTLLIKLSFQAFDIEKKSIFLMVSEKMHQFVLIVHYEILCQKNCYF